MGTTRRVGRVLFFNGTGASEIYTYGHTLARHDALPILEQPFRAKAERNKAERQQQDPNEAWRLEREAQHPAGPLELARQRRQRRGQVADMPADIVPPARPIAGRASQVIRSDRRAPVLPFPLTVAASLYSRVHEVLDKHSPLCTPLSLEIEVPSPILHVTWTGDM